MKRITLVWGTALVLVTIGIIVFFGFFYGGETKGTQLCQGVEIRIDVPEGATQYLDEKILMGMLRSMNLRITGVPIDSISVYDIENRLRRDQTFSNAQVYLSRSTNRVVINILQRVPLFIVEPNQAGAYYVNEDRSTHPISVGIAPYVPLVSGNITPKEATSSLYDMMKTLRANEYFQSYFGHIYINAQKQAILTPRIGRTLVYFGSLTDIEGKLHKLEVFNRDVVSKKGWDAFSYVKLDFKDQVIAKERYPKPSKEEQEDSFIPFD